MAIRFFVDFTGPLVELERAQLNINRGALRPAFESMRTDYREIMRDVYARSRTPGYKWPPNSLAYRRYDRLKGNSPPGVRTGRVRAAHVSGGGPGAVDRIGNNFMELGTSLNYANFSAAGKRRPRRGLRVDQFTQVFSKPQRRVVGRKIPVRDPLLALYTPATRAIRKRIREKWQEYILDAIGDSITEQTSIRIQRPRRQRQFRRRSRRR